MTACEQGQVIDQLSKIDVFAIALAITVIKAKRGDVSLRDYFSRVCDTLVTRQSSDSSHVSSSGHHLAEANETRLLQEQLSARDEQIRMLRQENEILRAALEAPIDAKLLRDQSDTTESWQQCLQGTSAGQESEVHKLLRFTYLAQSLMNTTEHHDHVRLDYCLQQILTTASKLLCAHGNGTHEVNDPISRHPEAYLPCARAVLVAYRGLELLSNASDHKRAVFATVQLYNDLLGQFNISREGSTVKDDSFEQRLNRLSAFVSHMVDQLKPELRLHKEVFEGYLVILITYIGQQLYPAAFGHARGPSLDAEIRASELAVDPKMTNMPWHTSLLTKLLKHAVDKAPIMLDPERSAVSTLRDRLQQTLVEAIFGHGPDTGFSHPLQLPALDVRSEESFSQGLTTAEWLVQEVWSIIGWDILAR